MCFCVRVRVLLCACVCLRLCVCVSCASKCSLLCVRACIQYVRVCASARACVCMFCVCSPQVCPGGWGRCGTDLASAVRVYAELARMGYTFIAFEVTSEARELLPNLSSLSSPVSLPPAGMHDLLELHINGEEDVRALLEPQMVSLFACMQLWLRPPASTKQ